MFFDSVIVASDGPGTNVPILANPGISQITEMRGFAPITHGALLQFNIIANLHISSDLDIGSQMSKGTYLASRMYVAVYYYRGVQDHNVIFYYRPRDSHMGENLTARAYAWGAL